jgi:hypothetical protein
MYGYGGITGSRCRKVMAEAWRGKMESASAVSLKTEDVFSSGPAIGFRRTRHHRLLLDTVYLYARIYAMLSGFIKSLRRSTRSTLAVQGQLSIAVLDSRRNVCLTTKIRSRILHDAEDKKIQSPRYYSRSYVVS